MSPPAQVLSAHAFVARNDAASPSLPVLDQTTDAATPFYSVPATSPRLRRGDADADADGRPMILRRLHVRVSRLSLASAALLDVAPRALPSAGLFRARGLHGAAGDDGASSEHGRKPAGPLTLYRNLVSQGKLTHDSYQENVASELDNLLSRLQQYEMEMEDYHNKLYIWENSREKERRKLLVQEAEDKQRDGVWIDEKRGFLDKLVTRRRRGNIEPGVGKWVSYLNREKKLDTLVGHRPVAPVAPKGLYLYGNVGSGKTMLMDMFYGATEGVIKHRRRFHFHEAMLEIHDHMHDVWKRRDDDKSIHSSAFNWISSLPFDVKIKEWLIGEEKYKQQTQEKHILLAVADKFLVDRQANKTGASILCFDEIQTIDVFAVVALSGILSRLLSTGTVLVATSNKAPEDLNQDGMQRDIFLELLSKLDENCNKILVGTEKDYRRLIPTEGSTEVHYFWPATSDARSMYEAMWSIEIPQSCNGVARFDFEYLCGRPVGAADYIAIARSYHTIFISDIPAMSMKIRDKARRFITLIDELYNHHCRLICLAASSIDDLFQGTEEGPLFDLESFQFETESEGTKLRRDVLAGGNVGLGPSTTGLVAILSGQEEMFAFRRAISRLIEMQTPLYLERVQDVHPSFRLQCPPGLASNRTAVPQPAPAV
ncbi:putative ATPase N2B isoform X2 [Sorghum bicolor]|uniref:putative ATPase N2B isoform X2 n=1 Tax=Sorghum bicolor TaxID=4558 RepID=UPI000B426B0B|nr:putative ATPase N2B isoform X2 [Sorghum bicolor]|eukprot:XP_021305223.1 putative ATPase N2B isoform X2 [Sorghum bicolor]